MKNYKLKFTLMLAMTTLILASCSKDDVVEETTSSPPATVDEPVTIFAESEYIGMPKAEEIALAHANTTASQVLGLGSSMDLKDETEIKYLVEFMINSTKYEYVIHAKTGDVLDFTLTMENDENTDVPENDDYIGDSNAQEIAYKDANIFDDDIDFTHTNLKINDEGVAVYDVEFYMGSVEYDYEVDALTGEILSFDNDAELFDVAIPEELILGETIGEDEAVRIACEDAGADSTSNLFVKLETDEDLSSHYWVEFLANNTQYGYEIQSVTGDILFKSSEDDENAINGVIVDQNDEESPYIGEGKAVSTAVNHAGFNPSGEITVDLVLTETKSMYHVGFSINSTSYKYEIDAINGKIMALDKVTQSYSNDISQAPTSNASVIGDEAAIDIALNAVGAKSASFIKLDFSIDSGVAVYNIDFRVDNASYLFVIDAITGNILDYAKG